MFKRIVRITAICLIVFSALLCARETNVTFTWTQNIPSDMGGWRIYKSTSSTGPWEQLFNIEYTIEQDEYTVTRAVEAPDNQTTTYYFSVSAYDDTGNESEKTLGDRPVTFDYQSPQQPVNFIISVE